MLNLGRACEMDLFFCAWYFMHSRFLSCIMLYVKYVWLWDLCDMCALYLDIYVMSLDYAHLLCFHVLLQFKWALLHCFASVFYSYSNELYFMYSCLIHIFWVHLVGLGHISMSNPFCSYCQKLIWTKHVEKLTHLFYILEVVLSSITKKGEIESI